MTAKGYAAAAALGAVLAAGAAQAATKVIAKAGSWETFDGTTVSGRPVCGMSSSQQGSYIGVKFFSGDKTVTIQLGRKTWRIENGGKQKLTMRFDGHSAWNATGTGMHFNDGDAGLEYTINRPELDVFMREYGSSAHLRIHFTGSNAHDWVTDLNGTSSVHTAFTDCLRRLK